MISFYGGPNGIQGEQGIQGEKGNSFSITNLKIEDNYSFTEEDKVKYNSDLGTWLGVYSTNTNFNIMQYQTKTKEVQSFLLGTLSQPLWYKIQNDNLVVSNKNIYLTRDNSNNLVEGQLDFSIDNNRLKISTKIDGVDKIYESPVPYESDNENGYLTSNDAKQDQIGDIKLRALEDDDTLTKNGEWVELPYMFQQVSKDKSSAHYSIFSEKYGTIENLVFKEIAKNQEVLTTNRSYLSDFFYDNKKLIFYIDMKRYSGSFHDYYTFTINNQNLIFSQSNNFPKSQVLWNSSDNTYFFPENKTFILRNGKKLFLEDYGSEMSNLTTNYAVYKNTEGVGCLIDKQKEEIKKSNDLIGTIAFFEVNNKYYIIKDDFKLYLWDNETLSISSSFIKDLSAIMPNRINCRDFYFSEKNKVLFFGKPQDYVDNTTGYFGMDAEKLVDISCELDKALFFKFFPRYTPNSATYFQIYSHYIIDSGINGTNDSFIFKLYDLESIFPITYSFTIPKVSNAEYEYLKIK